MYCANCGTKLQTSTCPICGAISPVGAGRRDAVTGLALAGWWLRVGATLFDGLVLVVPEFLIVWAMGNYTSTLSRLPVLALQGFYGVYLLSRPRGQTIGNRVAKTRVVSASSGQPITVTSAFIRWFVPAVFSFIFGVGTFLVLLDSLWPLWDQRRQTLHDKIAGTIVVLV